MNDSEDKTERAQTSKSPRSVDCRQFACPYQAHLRKLNNRLKLMSAVEHSEAFVPAKIFHSLCVSGPEYHHATRRKRLSSSRH